MLIGRLGDILTTIFLCAPRLPDHALLQVKAVQPTEFDVSMVWHEPATQSVRSMALKAFSTTYLAAEWCAKEAKIRTLGPRRELARVIKGDAVAKRRMGIGSVGKSPSGRGKAKLAHGNSVKMGAGKAAEPQNSNRFRASPKRIESDVKKAEASPERPVPQQPKSATGNQMWNAFQAARDRKKNE